MLGTITGHQWDQGVSAWELSSSGEWRCPFLMQKSEQGSQEKRWDQRSAQNKRKEGHMQIYLSQSISLMGRLEETQLLRDLCKGNPKDAQQDQVLFLRTSCLGDAAEEAAWDKFTFKIPLFWAGEARGSLNILQGHFCSQVTHFS